MGAGSYSIHVLTMQARMQILLLSEPFTITTMHRDCWSALDIANDRLYVVNLDNLAATTTESIYFLGSTMQTREMER